jgi:hypothetical protein
VQDRLKTEELNEAMADPELVLDADAEPSPQADDAAEGSTEER